MQANDPNPDASPEPVPVPTLTLQRATDLARLLVDNISKALRGKPEVVERTVTCLIARGHLLIEDVPGVGKTTLARATTLSIDGCYQRIQFTSDLLPSDLTGVSMPILTEGRPSSEFRFQPGPLFANLVLADEVNRASPKSQSALLEAMSEQTVTVDGITHPLPDPHFVIATQNPLEQIGTHALPESQLDRFLMRIAIGYPDPEYEAEVILQDPAASALPSLKPIISLDELLGLQQLAGRVKFSDSLVAYLLEIVAETRNHEALEIGISPRGAVALRRAAQSRALIDGRDFCIPEDLRDLAVDVLAHRIRAKFHAGTRPDGGEANWIMREILDRIPVPL